MDELINNNVRQIGAIRHMVSVLNILFPYQILDFHCDKCYNMIVFNFLLYREAHKQRECDVF